MNWGAKALVLEPDSLRDSVQSEAAAMLQKYRNVVEEKQKLSTCSKERSDIR